MQDKIWKIVFAKNKQFLDVKLDNTVNTII